MKQEDFSKLIERTITTDPYLTQQLNALESYGLIFKDIDTYFKLHSDNEYEINFEYRDPHFNKRFKDRYNLSFIEISYRDYQIQVEKIYSDVYITNKKKLEENFSHAKEELLLLKKEFGEEDNNEEIQMAFQNHEEKIESELEYNKKELARQKNEIELTTNSMLNELKNDIQKIYSKIDKVIEEYNLELESKNSTIFDKIRKFKNERVKQGVIRNFKTAYKSVIVDKKIAIQKVNKEIKSNFDNLHLLKNSISTYSNLKVLYSKKAILKEDLSNAKKLKNSIFEDIENLVEDKYNELLIEIITSVDNDIDVVVKETDLLKVCIPEYNKLMKGIQL